ncbi:MAG: aldehyde dehydrogenase (NADP(+)) [Bacteroidetes bacterium]|nr:aldehyde dehydrogenase (NADP(+)) [Bacteroidota bacterium]
MFGNQILGSVSYQGIRHFSSFDPTKNRENSEHFLCASDEEIEIALQSASISFDSFAQSTPQKRSLLLLQIVAELIEIQENIKHIYCKESGLSTDRFFIEFNRTINQLRLFASFLTNSYLEIQSETPENTDLSLPKLIKKRIGIGPVLVFGASNFPLAYSTIGGDTVSALAAGCPVIVKAHPFQPETSYLVGNAIQKAISKTDFHPGIFSQLFDDSYDLAKILIQDSRVKAVGFTGSFSGGNALLELINKREEPIPLFAEMGSSNPVFIFPELLKEKLDKWSTIFAKSITNDAGQFCTKPGIFFVPTNSDGREFVDLLTKKVLEEPSFTMLHPKIFNAFEAKKRERLEECSGELIEKKGDLVPCMAKQAILISSIESFLNSKSLQKEVFGPFALILYYSTKAELASAIDHLDGQLTASILLSDEEFVNNQDLIFKLSQKVGRIIKNGVPTGVRVCDNMHHGGPFPATTDSRFTAVGTDSIHRFTRSVVFQN